MKKTIFILTGILLGMLPFQAQKNITYYLSENGDDSNVGTSSDQPWKTFSKLSEIEGSLIPGDKILLKRGDVFRDELKLTAYGTEDNYIMISAYDEGNNPIISGSVVIENWEFTEDNIYKTRISGIQVTNLFLNNRQLTLARYPNSGYLKIDEVNFNKGFSSKGLAETGKTWSGANVIFRTNNWTWEKRIIKSIKPGNVTFDLPSDYDCRGGWGFFINNSMDALDNDYEWYFDEKEGDLYLKLPAGTNPNEMLIEATTKEYGLLLKGEYLSVDMIDFEKQFDAAIEVASPNVKVSNCNISHTCYHGINVRSPEIEILNCTLKYINGLGINLFSSNHVSIQNCNLNNIGLHPELSLSGQQKQVGILAIASTGTMVKNCVIDSTGYSGILFLADSCRIEQNIITNSMMRLNDGGALYCFGESSRHGILSNNIIKYVPGYGGATSSGKPEINLGIYLDNKSNNLIVEENTVAFAGGGIHGNAGTWNNSILNNVCYGNKDSQLSLADWGDYEYIENYLIKDNLLVCTARSSVPFRYTCYKTSCVAEERSGFSGNYYFNPFNISQAFPGNRSYDQWLEEADSSAVISFYEQSFDEIPRTELLINETNELKTIGLEGTYVDLDNQSLSEITLQPYSSRVVVDLEKNTTFIHNPKEEKNLYIFPNPVQKGSLLTINGLEANGIKVFRLFDLTNKCVMLKEISGNTLTIPDFLPASIYFIRIQEKNQFKTAKLIISD